MALVLTHVGPLMDGHSWTAPRGRVRRHVDRVPPAAAVVNPPGAGVAADLPESVRPTAQRRPSLHLPACTGSTMTSVPTPTDSTLNSHFNNLLCFRTVTEKDEPLGHFDL